MGKPFKIFLGISLAVAGIASSVCGLKLILSSDKYQAIAKVKTEHYLDDPVLNILAATNAVIYDPYFIQTTFEIIQSQLVLSNAIATLDLSGKWSKQRADGSRLNSLESMALIRNHLRLAPVRGTKLIAITYICNNPKEAADVANAIAESYVKYWKNHRQQMIGQALEAAQKQRQDVEIQILALQTNVEQLRQHFQIKSEVREFTIPEQQAYWDAKQRMEAAQVRQDKIKSKLEEVDLYWKTPTHTFGMITDPAEPSKSPIGPDRFLGAGLLMLGLGLLAGGLVLLKSTRKECVIVPPSLP